jgi:hypothetical protein
MRDRELVLFGYLDDVLQETKLIARPLVLATTGYDRNFDDVRDVWDGHADEFWRRTLPG